MDEHYKKIKDSDPYFHIDINTREIINESGKTVLIRGDHNSEEATFEIPRYVDGHDMLESKIKVDYINEDAAQSESSKDVYEAEKKETIDTGKDEVVIFRWLISGNATKHVGSLKFSIRFECYEDDQMVYRWGSALYSSIKILESLDFSPQIAQDYSDILEQWRANIELMYENSKSYAQAALEAQKAASISEMSALEAQSYAQNYSASASGYSDDAKASAESAKSYAQQAASVFQILGTTALTINEDSSITAIFTKE